MKYSDLFCDWLVEEGYTHCFFVAGGNIMHLLDSARSRFNCVPFVHEVAAGIAAEYFNESAPQGEGKAFALVTAGPGMTNLLTALAGAFLESRELLVIGGQVKSEDLASGGIRQRGIQEIDGIALAKPICKETLRIVEPVSFDTAISLVRSGSSPRKGPVFIEFCLDAQAAKPGESLLEDEKNVAESQATHSLDGAAIREAVLLLQQAMRPILLLGGGVSRADAKELVEIAARLRIPVATTWNGADRIGFDDPINFGRPNTWGMRWSNVLLQQADLVFALGTRLGMQQTGFNWRQFVPLGRVIQVDIDLAELQKSNPRVDLAICGDAGVVARALLTDSAAPSSAVAQARQEWIDFGKEVEKRLPLCDPANTHGPGFIDPFIFMEKLSALLSESDVIIPCSSGGAFTVCLQAFKQKQGQTIVTDKGLASMGYGLSGALGAALANPNSRVVLFEGDGGFAQNLQELGTLKAQDLNLKVFLFSNEGYASIRMTQRNYFGGAYVGCDTETGLGLPDWPVLFSAYGIGTHVIDASDPWNEAFMEALESSGPTAFLLPIDPEQTYFPKITSRVTANGSMESNPLHLMTPDLDFESARIVMPFFDLGAK